MTTKDTYKPIPTPSQAEQEERARQDINADEIKEEAIKLINLISEKILTGRREVKIKIENNLTKALLRREFARAGWELNFKYEFSGNQSEVEVNSVKLIPRNIGDKKWLFWPFIKGTFTEYGIWM